MAWSVMVAAVGMGVSDSVYCISYHSCFGNFGHGFEILLFDAWGEWCSGIAMAHGRGGRQGRQCTMRSALILFVALQLLFSRFISFRVVVCFVRPPTVFLCI